MAKLSKKRASALPPFASTLVDVAGQFLCSLVDDGSFQLWIDSSLGFHEFAYEALPFLKVKVKERLLKELLNRSRPELAARAAEQIVRVTDKWAEEMLDHELLNGSIEARCAILGALSSRDRGFALTRFVRACEDPNVKVREIARRYVSDANKSSNEKVRCGKCKQVFAIADIQRHIEHAHTPIRDAVRNKSKNQGKNVPIDRRSRGLLGDFWEWDMTTPNTPTYRRGR